MSSTIDFNDILINAQKQRKKISQIIDTYYLEIDDLAGGVITAPSTEEMWGFRDRVEEMRGSVYKIKKSTSRNVSEAREAYYDSMRSDKARGSGDGHYEERAARYEINNITEYKILTNMERTLVDIENFSFYLEGRLRWIKDRMQWQRDEEKWSRMKY